uniref:Transmembrane protein n=1 Tax=Steinernema glaseri TaxID=37863 RepID=A0A1I7ZLG8_9BILA
MVKSPSSGQTAEQKVSYPALPRDAPVAITESAGLLQRRKTQVTNVRSNEPTETEEHLCIPDIPVEIREPDCRVGPLRSPLLVIMVLFTLATLSLFCVSDFVLGERAQF